MTATALPGSPLADRVFCETMLPKVSRTFAICIRLLPQDLEHSVLVAYLLCRIADTIEDSTAVPAERKQGLLAEFSSCLTAPGRAWDALRIAFAQPASDEEILAREADSVLRSFHRLPIPQQEAVRPWVQEMSVGMGEFAARRARGGQSQIETIATVEELDRYCYFVAGTVGHLLTELFLLHAGGREERRSGPLRSLATSFGLGLQLTNIIKDVGDDRLRGWSFVPRELCQLAGITPTDLHDPLQHEAGHRVMHLLIEKAKRHLLDALEYSAALPRRQYGIRLFCLTSLYFAVRTLRSAERDDRLLDPDHKVKISRPQVYRTIAMARLVAPSNGLVRWYFRRLAGGSWPPCGYVATPARA